MLQNPYTGSRYALKQYLMKTEIDILSYSTSHFVKSETTYIVYIWPSPLLCAGPGGQSFQQWDSERGRDADAHWPGGGGEETQNGAGCRRGRRHLRETHPEKETEETDKETLQTR